MTATALPERQELAMKTKTKNPNSRALVSSMKCDLLPLRAAAVTIVDDIVGGSERPALELVKRLDVSANTANAILRERARLRKTGARR